MNQHGWQMVHYPLNESWEWLLLCDRTSQLFEMDMIIIPRRHSVALWLKWLGVDQKKKDDMKHLVCESQRKRMELLSQFVSLLFKNRPVALKYHDGGQTVHTCTLHMLSKNNNLPKLPLIRKTEVQNTSSNCSSNFNYSSNTHQIIRIYSIYCRAAHYAITCYVLLFLFKRNIS